jgi:hypothetical protein
MAGGDLIDPAVEGAKISETVTGVITARFLIVYTILKFVRKH